MKFRMFFHYLCVLSCFFIGVFLIIITSFAQGGIVEDETVQFQEYEIPVVESNRPLITGVKIEVFLKKYIPEFEDFEYKLVGGFKGLGARGRLKPVPNRNLAYVFDSSKPHVPIRRWAITIGVYRSHREALLAALRHFSGWNITVEADPLDKENPGFVSWGDDRCVIDNVYAGFSSGEIPNKKAIQNELKQGLLHGAEWVIKGGKPIPPQIQGEDFPSEFSLWIDRKAEAPLPVMDPNERKIFKRFFALNLRGYDKEYEPGPMGLLAEIHPTDLEPILKWKPSGIVEIIHRGNVTFDLEAVAVNDLCVVSDVFKKEIRINVPEE